MTIGKRLTSLYDYLKERNVVKNKQDFCEKLGIDYTALNKYMKDEVAFKTTGDIFRNFSKNKIDLGWILDGQGTMFLDSAEEEKSPVVLEGDIYLQKQLVDTRMKIPILDIKASAGYGIMGMDNPNVIDWLDMSTHVLAPYARKNVVCVEIKGDSMEPDFRSGDLVLCAVGVVESNGFYVININGNILFKRLQFIKQEKIIVKSINLAYDPEEITNDEKEYFGIIGKVFKHIRKI